MKVAIAGGSAGVGRELVDAILATKKHEVIVLSRSDDAAGLPADVALKKVDYTNHEDLVDALQGVHTVICTFFMAGTGVDGPNVKAQKALIKASAEVGVKRYAPSEFGSIPGKQGEKAVIQEELTKYPQLEYTLYITGLFMDYFLGSKNTSYLKKLKVFIDPDKGEAFEVPGDGNDSLVFIKIGDAAKFVAASLDLEKWPRLAGMVGERTTYNNVIKTLEKIQGRKYPVTYRSLEEMQTRTSRWDMLGLITVSGNFNNEDTLNKLLPQVKPVGLEELLSSVLG